MTIEELQNKITDAENTIVRANVALDSIRLELAELKRKGDVTPFRVRTPDRNTPINTICRSDSCTPERDSRLFFRGYDDDGQILLSDRPLWNGTDRKSVV